MKSKNSGRVDQCESVCLKAGTSVERPSDIITSMTAASSLQ